MADLDKLMNLTGAVAAFEYGDGGKLVDSRLDKEGPLDKNMLDLLCHMCAANTCIATMQARGWESVTGSTGFYPVQGFTLVGFEWSTVTHAQHGVVLRNDQVDYELAYQALAEQAPA